MKLIDKDRITAEIERLKGQLIRGACASQVSMETNCKVEAYNEVLSFLDAIEAKEVDLEKELDYDEYITFFKEHPEYNNEDWGFNECWVFAKHFFELGIKAQKGE